MSSTPSADLVEASQEAIAAFLGDEPQSPSERPKRKRAPAPSKKPKTVTEPSPAAMSAVSDYEQSRSLVSVAFRVPPDLAQDLRKVAALRSVNRNAPFTQQDIAEQALREWIERNPVSIEDLV